MCRLSQMFTSQDISQLNLVTSVRRQRPKQRSSTDRATIVKHAANVVANRIGIPVVFVETIWHARTVRQAMKHVTYISAHMMYEQILSGNPSDEAILLIEEPASMTTDTKSCIFEVNQTNHSSMQLENKSLQIDFHDLFHKDQFKSRMILERIWKM